MKRIFVLFALVAATMVSCETENSGGDGGNYVLTLASTSVMNFEAEGGVGEIGYALTEVTRSSKPATPYNDLVVDCSVDWITDIAVAESITFKVLPNDGAEREVVLKVKYYTQSVSVLVRQESEGGSYDVEFEATHLGGSYYGKLQSTGYDYFMILSNMQPKGIYSVPYEATEYRLDLYADKGAAFDNVRRIPVGTYKLDHTRSGAPFTIDGYSTCSYLYDGASDGTTPFADATVIVSEDGIEASIKLFNGDMHHVVYKGSLVMEDYSEPTYADVYPVSQYTSTIAFDVTGGTIMPIFRGNYYDSESDVWFVHMIERKNGFSGVYLLLDLLVPRSVGGYDNKEGFLGEFSLLDPEAESWDYTFPAGRLRDDSMQLHAWYAYCANGQLDMSTAAPITAGEIKFEKSDEGGYIITIDGKDDNGNKIEGTFKGVINEYQNQAYDL